MYKNDLMAMTDYDIIENMAAELYKLNDINRQKAQSMKWVILCFAVSITVLFLVGVILLINIL